MQARYVHTNIIADDWRVLARFYQAVFGCVPVPPERDFQGAELESLTGIVGAHLSGMHLRLPGHGEMGPTLEIFQYNSNVARQIATVDRPGFAHIAFSVDDVMGARDEVLAAGGQAIGEVVTLDAGGAGRVTVAYMTDPEGNIIELQSWSR